MRKIMLLAFIASASLYAKDIKLSETVVKTSGNYEGSVSKNESKNMVLITKEDIQKKNYNDIIDVFKDSPVTMVTYTKSGPLVALRGSGEKTVMRVKVLVDGKTINTMDDSMGVIPFDAIPVASIEKIEIIPGGGITLYGSGSSSGVINIVTQSGVDKDFGLLTLGASSFDTYNTSLNKGISITDKVFVNFGVEGEKGKGYREKEKHKKINLLGGIQYKINDKNKIRLSGTKYKEDADSTNEISKIQLKKDRRKAGTALSNIDSNKNEISIDYEYKPTENLTLVASGSKSKFTRDIVQHDKPFMTVLPGGESFTDLNYEDIVFDIAALNVENGLTGKFEENIGTAKLTGDYSYGKGKLSFGTEKIDHELIRKMNFNTGKMTPLDDINLLMHPKDLKSYTEEELMQRSPGRIPLSAFNMLLTMSNYDFPKWNRVMNKLSLKYATPEEKKAILNNPDGWEYYPISYKNPDIMNKDLMKIKLKDLADPIIVDGKIGLKQRNLDTGEYSNFKEVDLNQTFGEFLNEDLKSSKIYDENLRVQNIVNAKVDVKKKTESMYLYNDYDLTDKLSINTGIRWERAKYSGYRNTQNIMKIYGNPEKGWTGLMTDVAMKSSPLTSSLENYLDENSYDNYKKLLLDNKFKQMKENGYAVVPSAQLHKRINKKEDNIGGEIGFNYQIDDINTIYTKYERGFTTPLPTQLTNKTWDSVTNMRLYWDSNLKTEKVHNFEIGYRGMINDNISLSLAGFMSQTKDEIVTAVRNGNSHMLREWRFLNIEKTRRLGVEIQSEQNFDKLTLRQSFTYVDPRIISNDYDSNTKKIIKNRIDDYRNNFVESQSKLVLKIKARELNEKVSDSVRPYLNKVLEEIADVPLKVVKGEYALKEVDEKYINSQAAKDELDRLEKEEKDISKGFEAAREIAIEKSDQLEQDNIYGVISDDEYDKQYNEIWDNWNKTYENDLKKYREITNKINDINNPKDSVMEKNIDMLLKNSKTLEELAKIYDKNSKINYELEEERRKYKDRNSRRENAFYFDDFPEEKYEEYMKKHGEFNEEMTKKYAELAKESEDILQSIREIRKFAKKYVIASKKDIDVFKAQAEWEMKHVKEGVLKKNERIPMVPKIKATFGADYEFTDKLKLGTNVTYVGSYNTLEPGRGYDLIISKVPGHLLTDIHG